jgi:hypothetical protein
MDTALARLSIHSLSDDQLLEFLRTQEDRLTREIVDEAIRRADPLIPRLTEICRDERSWKQGDELYWVPVHASFILGATADERAVKGLLAALQWSARYNVDWVYRAIPAMMGRVGRPAMGVLMTRARDSEAAELDRTLALHCLGAIAARHPVQQGEILDFLKVVVEEGEEEWIRSVAACILLKFARPGDRKLLTVAAIRQAWSDRPALFSSDDVKEAFDRGVLSVDEYLRDWLEFYRPQEIEARERRWQEKADDDRWAAGVSTGAAWVHDRIDRFLRRYESSLLDLGDEDRGNAVWVAESMAEYNVWHERLAPWRWNGQTSYAYLMDYLARRISAGAPGHIGVVPENLLRFVRFCFAEGCILERDWRGAEAVVAAEREEFVAAAGDPDSRRIAREVIEALLVRGKDPADPASAEMRSEFFLSTFLTHDEAPGGLEDRSALSRAELRDGSTRRRQRAFHP